MRRFAFDDRLSIDFDDEEAFCAPRRLPLSRAKRSARLRRRLALGALAALAIGCVVALRQPSEPSSLAGAGELPAPPPAWAPIAKSQPLFAIAAPDFALQPRNYAARRHRIGGGRQDILDFGDVAGSSPYLRLIIYRVGTEATLEAAFFVELARRAAETGRAITFAAQPTALPTRLGTFETANLNMIHPGGADAACVGFRRATTADSSSSLRIAGFACAVASGDGAPLLAKEELACFIDAIELLRHVDDKDLVAFFAARELTDETACRKSISNDVALQEPAKTP